MNRCILLGGGVAAVGMRGTDSFANHCLISGFESGVQAFGPFCGAYC